MVTIKSKNVNASNTVKLEGNNLREKSGMNECIVKVVSEEGTAHGSPSYITEGVKGPR